MKWKMKKTKMTMRHMMKKLKKKIQSRVLKRQMKDRMRIPKMMEVNLSMKSSGKPLARTSNLESLKIKETELSLQSFLGKYFFF